MATGNTLHEPTTKLQQAADDIATWARKWRIKLHETVSTYINFTKQKIDQRSILNAVTIPPANTAKYLGMTPDAKLRWKAHIKEKQGERQIKFRKMYWPLGRRSELSMYNKPLLYTQMLRPLCTYGVHLWGCAKKGNIDVI
jgi:hypothetical protein